MNVPSRTLAELSVEDWRKVVDVNLNGTFHLVHHVLPTMREQKVPLRAINALLCALP